ncbi:5600_t:CDS:2 [Gigaspora margarita]|uniref:5600_t:CDS:1 n=1 Tax=Gigaspora margarita TaxID=4874 RepID=A0ABN7UKR9_GIGMA|nr:5600_t:CDS:2 [Gigaspora margarita]
MHEIPYLLPVLTAPGAIYIYSLYCEKAAPGTERELLPILIRDARNTIATPGTEDAPNTIPTPVRAAPDTEKAAPGTIYIYSLYCEKAAPGTERELLSILIRDARNTIPTPGAE